MGILFSVHTKTCLSLSFLQNYCDSVVRILFQSAVLQREPDIAVTVEQISFCDSCSLYLYHT